MNRAFRPVAMALACCGAALPGDATASTPVGEAVGAIVAAGPVSKPAVSPSAVVVPPASAPSPPAAPVAVPAGAIYVCVTESGGVRREAPIEFAPNVGALCAKHPEMGPCQYERNVCRNKGGRVYAAGGVEVTLQMEAEYDRKVMRVRIR